MIDGAFVPEIVIDPTVDPIFTDILSNLLDIKICFSVLIFMVAVGITLLLVLIFATLWGG